VARNAGGSTRTQAAPPVTQLRSLAPAVDGGGRLPFLQGVVVFTPLVFSGAILASLLRYPQIGSAVLFPAYAVLVTALFFSPRRHWKWYIAISVLAHAVASFPQWPWSWVLLADVANITRALLATLLLQRAWGSRLRFDNIRGFLWFVISTVVVAPAVGAVIGAADIVLHGGSPTFWRPLVAWYAANALTALTLLPVLLVATDHVVQWRLRGSRPTRIREGLFLVGALALLLSASLWDTLARWSPTLPVFGVLPALIWAALRFGPGTASFALTLVTFSAILAADRGTLHIFAVSTDENALNLQMFVLFTSLPVMWIAVVASARRDAVYRYRALLSSMQDHVAILDANGIVLEVNESWSRYAKMPSPCSFERVATGDDFLAACREALVVLERDFPNRDHAAARAMAGVADVLAHRQRRFEMEYDLESGGEREWYLLRAEALERFDGGAVLTRSDITARHKAQLEIEEQRRDLSHLARVAVLGQLTGALAHELRQPLSSILSNAEAARHLIKREVIDIGELREILADIVSEDRRATQVIDGLRALLKRGETHAQLIDTRALVQEVLQLAHAELIAHRVTATPSLDDHLPPLVADRVQVQQVLLNLILNAVEAMGSAPIGDRMLTLKVRATDHREVQFSIVDSGPGIPQAMIARLFEPFVTTKAEGLGLGLSIARSIVVAHGGRIWVENNPHGGASVHCFFGSATPSPPHGIPRQLMDRGPRASANAQ
jgi:two-component system, LuxR family, sensor kinase FixL